MISKRLKFPQDDRTDASFIVPQSMHFQRSKSALDSLKKCSQCIQEESVVGCPCFKLSIATISQQMRSDYELARRSATSNSCGEPRFQGGSREQLFHFQFILTSSLSILDCLIRAYIPFLSIFKSRFVGQSVASLKKVACMAYSILQFRPPYNNLTQTHLSRLTKFFLQRKMFYYQQKNDAERIASNRVRRNEFFSFR